MDRVLNWLSTEFPPGWFDGLKFTDWLSVASLAVALFVAWKTLGPRRKTKLEVALGTESYFFHQREYHRLLVVNNGHYPAHEVTLESVPRTDLNRTYRLGDLNPWQVKKTGTALRNHGRTRFVAKYRDADNKMTRQRLKIEKVAVWSEEEDVGHISFWSDGGRNWRDLVADALEKRIGEWWAKRDAKRDALRKAKREAIRNAKRNALRRIKRNAEENTLD